MKQVHALTKSDLALIRRLMHLTIGLASRSGIVDVPARIPVRRVKRHKVEPEKAKARGTKGRTSRSKSLTEESDFFDPAEDDQ